MFAFMAGTARTGSNATLGPPSGSNVCIRNGSLQSLAKGSGNLEQQGVKRAYAIFNNCYQNFGIMNATTMAAILRGQEQ